MNSMPDFSSLANHDTTSINKEPARTWFLPYSCRCNALSGARILNGHTPESAYAGIISEKSSRRKILNGDWSYIHSNDIDNNTENWRTTKVPDNNNDAGVYKREFALPSAWTGRDVFINFDGVGGFFYVYINDEFAGASVDTFSPAEINITPLLKAGKNTVTVKVLKQNADKSEGIFRDVYLLARTHEHIKDINIKTNLDTIYIEVFASKENGAATVEIYDDNNQLLIRKDSIIKESKASFEIKVENPINWIPEKPYLYTVLIHGFNEVIPQRVALRTITQNSDDTFSINGRLVILKSINDIFFESPCPLNSILSELLLLKMHNINCLQIHKNNITVPLLNLCDEIGFIVNSTTESSCARRSDLSDLFLLKAAYSPVSAKAHEMTFTKQTYAFTNHTDFTNLAEFDIAYIIKTPSQVFAQGILNINCAPHETVCESIDFTFPEFSFEEFFIEFKYKLKKDTVWAHAGFPTGFDQIKLPVLQTIPETETTTSMPPMSVHFSEPNEKGIMTVEGEDFTYCFDMAKGTFTSIVFNAVEMLKNAPQFSIDKESVQQVHFCRVLSKGSKYVTILASYCITTPKAATSVNFSVLWAIYGSGEIGVGVTVEVPTETPTLSRFGFDVMMPADKNFIRYYGYGPFSSYYNMKKHCAKGIYKNNVAERSSNHFGVQWAIVHDFQGRGIMFKGMPEFQLGLLDDTLKIDYKQTDIEDKQFLYSFTFKPIFTGSTDILRESRTLPGITEV